MTLRLRPPVVAAPRDRSFWLQNIGADAVTEPLEGKCHAEVAIVGGGYHRSVDGAAHQGAGAGDARDHAWRPISAAPARPGRNGGQVHTWFAEIDLLAAVVGARRGAPAVRRLPPTPSPSWQQLQRSGTIDMDLRLDGWLWTASSKAQEGAWDERRRDDRGGRRRAVPAARRRRDRAAHRIARLLCRASSRRRPAPSIRPSWHWAFASSPSRAAS